MYMYVYTCVYVCGMCMYVWCYLLCMWCVCGYMYKYYTYVCGVSICVWYMYMYVSRRDLTFSPSFAIINCIVVFLY